MSYRGGSKNKKKEANAATSGPREAGENGRSKEAHGTSLHKGAGESGASKRRHGPQTRPAEAAGSTSVLVATKQGVGTDGQAVFRLSLLSHKVSAKVFEVKTVPDGVNITVDSDGAVGLSEILNQKGWTVTEKPSWRRFSFRPSSHYSKATEANVIAGLLVANDLPEGSIVVDGPTMIEKVKGQDGQLFDCRRHFVIVSPEVEKVLKDNGDFLLLSIDRVRFSTAPHRPFRPNEPGKSQ